MSEKDIQARLEWLNKQKIEYYNYIHECRVQEMILLKNLEQFKDEKVSSSS